MLISFLFETIGRYFRYRSQLASINELDDRILSDIGLNRGELRITAWHLVHRARARCSAVRRPLAFHRTKQKGPPLDEPFKLALNDPP
jgi:uncharacterized protein YjiS (DUF1127 family)